MPPSAFPADALPNILRPRRGPEGPGLGERRMSEMRTVADLVAAGEAGRPAIRAPERAPLTYAGLRGLVERTVAALNRIGVGRGDRVAIVLPNGPEMATAFVSIAAGATTAPLNPGLQGRGVRVLPDRPEGAGARRAAGRSRRRRGRWRSGWACRCCELVPEVESGAGCFILEGGEAGDGRRGRAWPESDDVALVLHTSGTTSRPKIVPLTQRNVTASARNIARTLALSPRRPLPEHHAAVPHPRADGGGAGLARRAAAAVVCTPGFNALRFFGWLDAERPTWYTAVPTMHQAILARAERNRGDHRRGRSCASSAPPRRRCRRR